MGKPLTTDALVNSTKRRAMLPSSSDTFKKQDYIDILNEEMDIGVVPFILSTHEEYLLHTIDIDFSTATSQIFRIPSRAIGNKLRGADYVTSENNLQEMTRIDIDDLYYFQNSFNTYNGAFAFYVQNDELHIVNAAPTGVSLRMYFYMRPASLVEEKYAAIIQNINTTTGEIQVDKVPTTFINTLEYDFTEHRAPNKLLGYDKASTAVNSTTKVITFAAADLPENLRVGDYITLAEETIVPQIPVELHPLIAQRAAVHCLHALGDAQAIQTAEMKMQQMETKTVDLIDNRVENSPQKVNNLHSTLRQMSGRNRSRRGR